MLPIIAFRKTLEFEYGVVEQVSPLIRRIIAPNPSAFTFHGTGTYIVGHGRVAVVDPGPALGDHIDAILSALETEEISHILVTHTHMDHSPAARPLQAVKGGVVLAYGRHGSGKIDAGHKVEEGGDLQFAPDTELRPASSFSDFMVAVFGEKGRGARSAVGMGSLPFQIPVEVEMIVEID